MNFITLNSSKTLVSILVSSALLASISGCNNRQSEVDTMESTLDGGSPTQGVSDNHVENSTLVEGVNTEDNIKVMTLFPNLLASLNVLVHPLVPVEKMESAEGGLISSIKSKKYEEVSYGLQPVSDFEFDGLVSNLVFEDLSTSVTTELFQHNNFLIDNVFIPHSFRLVTRKDNADNANHAKPDINHDVTDIHLGNRLDIDNVMNDSNEGIAEPYTNDNNQNTDEDILEIPITYSHILYRVSQTPYSADKKGENINSQQSLYMSDTNGSQLMKLHPDNEYLIAVEWEPKTLRYYFITQKDEDKNGVIDNKDSYHNYQIDFKKTNPVATQYNFDK